MHVKPPYFPAPNASSPRANDDAPNNTPGDIQRDQKTMVKEKTEKKVKRPSMYKVILINDDFTPMDFVIDVLQRFFHKTFQEASDLMMTVHLKGSAVCGIFTRDVAETKVIQIVQFARQHQHPLQATMEAE